MSNAINLVNDMTKPSASYEEYKRIVKSLADKKDGFPFHNSGEEHAAIVMSNIFRTAQKELFIIAGDFNGKVSSNPDYLLEFKSFLERGGSAQILLDKDFENINAELQTLLKFYNYYYPEKVYLGFTDNKFLDSTTGKPVHITIGDSRMYRLEYDTSAYMARCSFNDPEKVSEYLTQFKELKEKSTAVQPS